MLDDHVVASVVVAVKTQFLRLRVTGEEGARGRKKKRRQWWVFRRRFRRSIGTRRVHLPVPRHPRFRPVARIFLAFDFR